MIYGYSTTRLRIDLLRRMASVFILLLFPSRESYMNKTSIFQLVLNRPWKPHKCYLLQRLGLCQSLQDSYRVSNLPKGRERN